MPSPEQIRGEPLMTASDVYSLGVLLYRLLTGELPYAAGALPEELDSIVRKATKNAPEERYGSAAQLAEDLRRYLRGFPVQARPDTLIYRARKFVQRHRSAVAAAALFVIALVVVVATSWQAYVAGKERARAERHFNAARELATVYLADEYDAVVRLPGGTALATGVTYHRFARVHSLLAQAQSAPATAREEHMRLSREWATRAGDVLTPLRSDVLLGKRVGKLLEERAAIPWPGSVAAECLRYGDVSLTGRLVQQVHAGRPDYESVTKGDEPLVIWILLLENGICIVDGESGYPRTFSEREIQVVLGGAQYASAAEYAPYRHLLGKNVNVAGRLAPGGGKYERRFVLLPHRIETAR